MITKPGDVFDTNNAGSFALTSSNLKFFLHDLT